MRAFGAPIADDGASDDAAAATVVPPTVDVPTEVAASLREHQRQGLSWLVAMHARGCGAILGDEMGLGKTVRQQSTPTMIHASAPSPPHAHHP